MMAESTDSLVPLRSWIKDEAKKLNNCQNDRRKKKEVIVRLTTVAYGIAEMLKLVNSRPNGKHSLEEEVQIDNFCVHVGREADSFQHPWDDINGIRMISTGSSLTMLEPSYLSCLLSEEEKDGQMGRYLEVELEPSIVEGSPSEGTVSTDGNDNRRCQLFARLLYELFSHQPFPDEDVCTRINGDNCPREPAHKKTKVDHLSSRKELMLSRARGDFDNKADSTQTDSTFQVFARKMQELGIPVSICLMTQNLLESGLNGDKSGDAYNSLRVLSEDLHLLLLDPERFLFDKEVGEHDNADLLYRKEKLYGRDREESLITDAFCRVSRGKSEAILIGGFSGSGKSKLVNSLRDRVDAVGGYVLTYKYDDISKEKPLFGVVSALNQLCAIIKERNTSKGLLAITNKLKNAFGDDYWLLASLLPNISLLSFDFIVNEKPASETINLRSLCCTLVRFVRVLSSPVHPIMLFLDDVQWADDTALDVIHSILSDTRGSCMFFVGTYRDNEVLSNHAIYNFVEKLEASNVPTKKFSLTGLNQEDLNTMISDALCLYPRICKPLSDIVFQKTKGNPFFVLEFMQSLCTRGLLWYNRQQKRWVWNESIIRSEEITDNVKYLLASKLNGLPGNLQGVLKVLACFGTSTSEQLIGYLSETIEYSAIRKQLDDAISGGFIEKDGKGGFKFVHDKVREAAYNLIPTSDKNQFHYDLGKLLHATCKGKEVGDVQFVIVSQINRGLQLIESHPSLRMEIAELNMKAGNVGLDRSDFVTANSYFSVSLSLLPEDHWNSMYTFCRSLYFSVAKAAYSSANLEKAQKALQKIIDESKCLNEKLDALHLLVTVLVERDAQEQAFTTSFEVLLQLGETIPDSFDKRDARAMVKKTSKILGDISEESMSKMKEVDKKTEYILMFYNHISGVAFFAKPAMVPYFSCRMMQLSMENGISKYSIGSFLNYAGMLCNNKVFRNIEGGCRLGRIVMKTVSSKRFGSCSDQKAKLCFQYYALIAYYSEPFQHCRDMLREGVEAGLGTGDVRYSFLNALNSIRLGLLSGKNLQDLLKETEYYLSMMGKQKDNQTKALMLMFHETISLLISNSEYTAPTIATGSIIPPLQHCFHKALQSFFKSRSERCNHFAEKIMQAAEGGRQHHIFITFYYALNSFKVAEIVHTKKINAVPDQALSAFRAAAEHSKDNFQNKVELLEAELYNRDGENDKAKASYAAAIASARLSKFIHEEGLACEKAALHHKKIGETSEALNYFTKAQECYKKWGSQVKADEIERQIELMQM